MNLNNSCVFVSKPKPLDTHAYMHAAVNAYLQWVPLNSIRQWGDQNRFAFKCHMLGIKYQIKLESLRQTDSHLRPASATSPPAPPPFSSQGPRDSRSPLDELDRGVTGGGQGLIDSLLRLCFPPHTHTPLSFYTNSRTHTHTPSIPPCSCTVLGVCDSPWASAPQAAQHYTYKSQCVSLVKGPILTLSL